MVHFVCMCENVCHMVRVFNEIQVNGRESDGDDMTLTRFYFYKF